MIEPGIDLHNNSNYCHIKTLLTCFCTHNEKKQKIEQRLNTTHFPVSRLQHYSDGHAYAREVRISTFLLVATVIFAHYQLKCHGVLSFLTQLCSLTTSIVVMCHQVECDKTVM